MDRNAIWPLSSLDSLSRRIFVGLAEVRHVPLEQPSPSLPLINLRDLRSGAVSRLEELATRSVDSVADVDRYRVEVSDVLITCRGAVLKVALVPAELAGALVSAHLIAVRTGPTLLPSVLFAYLASPAGHAALLDRSRSSSMTLSLSPSSLATLPIPVPPLSVQASLSSLIESAQLHYVTAIRAAEQRRAVASAIFTKVFQTP